MSPMDGVNAHKIGTTEWRAAVCQWRASRPPHDVGYWEEKETATYAEPTGLTDAQGWAAARLHELGAAAPHDWHAVVEYVTWAEDLTEDPDRPGMYVRDGHPTYGDAEWFGEIISDRVEWTKE